MTLQEIQARITELNEALSDKGYVSPDCDLTIEGSGDAEIWIKSAREGSIEGRFDNISGESIEGALNAADEYIANLESVYDHKKKQAVKQFGRAVDALREADISADFVDPLSEALQAMTENLLTHEVAA